MTDPAVIHAARMDRLRQLYCDRARLPRPVHRCTGDTCRCVRERALSFMELQRLMRCVTMETRDE
jgi:hypothetical protein